MSDPEWLKRARGEMPASTAVDGVIARALGSRPKFVREMGPRVDPVSDAFLGTYEWRRLRFRALEILGARCMSCGDTSSKICVDHVISRRKRPDLALELTNLQILCEACNHGKSWDSERDFRSEAHREALRQQAPDRPPVAR